MTAPLTRQTAFTHVVQHARKQGIRCLDTAGFPSWEHSGRMCFIGSLLEKQGEGRFGDMGAAADRLEMNRSFVAELGAIHDKQRPEDWEEKFVEFASEWSVEVPS